MKRFVWPQYTVASQYTVVYIGKPRTEAGLRFKIPFIQKINRYEKRIMRWDGEPKEIPTRDKRFIYVDTTARWQIVDAQKFLEVLGTYNQAYAKLDDIIDAVLRDYVSANLLVELVRTTNEMLTVEEVEGKVLSPFQEATAPEKVLLGRENITRAILAEASKAMPAFGIKLVDVNRRSACGRKLTPYLADAIIAIHNFCLSFSSEFC